MLFVSNQEHLSDKPFTEFVSKAIEKTKDVDRQSRDYRIVEKVDDYLNILEKAFKHLSRMSKKKKIASTGVEWFLDNYYIIMKSLELLYDDLPKNFFHKLPSITNQQSIPRIYSIAQNLIAYHEVDLVQNNLYEFLNEYQKTISLKMSELWALPLMLRLTLVEILAGTIFELIEDQELNKSLDNLIFPNLKPDEIVARAIQTLLLFDRLDWKELFETHSQVDKVLQNDPLNIYQKMDFTTRDQYRKKIENLADKSELQEIDIAKRALLLAKKANQPNNKTSHIGYYLIGDGYDQLRKPLNDQVSLSEKFIRFFYNHNSIFYLSGITMVTLLVVYGMLILSHPFINRTWQLIVIGILSIVPASSVAVNLINSILTATLPPRILPKMDFSKRIPKPYRTVVAIPALLTSQKEIQFLLKQLELHYLANNDPNIGFVLLSDYRDASIKKMPEDDALLSSAISGIEALNDSYQGDGGRRPFFVFHRLRQWNPQEGVWMGWERKRGKLEDFNRYLLEGFEDSFESIIGEIDFLKKVQFVITVDADTVLPRDSANKLIATLAHPLNRAEFDETSSKVTGGYTILQPRTEVKPTSVNKSLFSRVFAGDLGLDLYTRAVSDVYQDLFGEGSYVGKGIYDVEAFHRSLHDNAPDNALLSHDLFEGLLGRAGLVSDVVFFEEYPPNYSSQVNRLHRWVRGDWQLLPWLFPKVPMRGNVSTPNRFSSIGLWKIFDNLRRSMLAPATFFSLLAGWLFFKEQAWVWTIFLLFISAFPLFYNIVTSLSSRFLMGAKANVIGNIQTAFFRWVFWLIFLPYESLIMFDAISTTLIRVFISRKRLLQWQTAAHTIRVFGKMRKVVTMWQHMIGAPLISIAVGVLIYLINFDAFWVSLPFLLLWIMSPQVAYWTSFERKQDVKSNLKETDLQKFRDIARRTWLYFERFIGPEDHWLPPDHFQEHPKGMVAHRTSPTNIGLMMLSTAAAYDFGYIGVLDFIYRMNYTFETLDGMEKYRGHLFNWYDTQNLETLSPRYVSTVDSGNYAMSLIGLYQTLNELCEHTLCPNSLFQGVFDSLDVFCSIVSSIRKDALAETVQTLLAHCRQLQKEIKKEQLTDSRQMILLDNFEERLIKPMNVLIMENLGTENVINADTLQDLRYWSDAIFQQLTNLKRQIEILAPWMEIWRERPAFFDELDNTVLHEVFSLWHQDCSLTTKLSEVPLLCENTIARIEEFMNEINNQTISSLSIAQSQKLITWLEKFSETLHNSKDNAVDIIGQNIRLMEIITFYLERMEFGFLYDKKREVFFLGYQVDSGRLDQNHYDLLASEARTASLFAIALNQVPRSHWLHMGRPFTSVSGIPTLVSWNGSMFEYLMPNLFTRTYPETLLHQTGKGVVKAQIKYARQQKVPWGISETSYYRFDQADNYQYKGFGVPNLGRKRGLADDLVITPYASLLAVGIDPKAVLKNMEDLEEQGALGHFGFFEAIDYTVSRLPVGQDRGIIKSYMAHHQGMILMALANFMNPTTIVDRVHSDPRIQSTELLLQEQIPQTETVQKSKEMNVSIGGQDSKSISLTPWMVDVNQPGRMAHVISNGRLRYFMTDTGSGYLEWNETALTRWTEDATLDSWGLWFYIQDIDNHQAWSIGRQPIHVNSQEYQVIFAPHMMEIRHTVNDVRTILQTTITPKDDICVHKVMVTNQSDEMRQYRVLSYGEVVLAPQATDQQHPAFNKLFINSKYHDDLNMLHYQRRKRAADEENFGMAHLIFDQLTGEVEYEGDREKFIGRGHNISNPLAVKSANKLSATVGITLDPIFSLGKRFALKPNQTATFTFMTFPAEDEKTAVRLARKIRNESRVQTAFSSAESNSNKLLRVLHLDSAALQQYQALLSRIIYPVPQLRAKASLLKKNQLGQSGLWPFGISGDFPIFLVMIDNKSEMAMLQETLLAHTYWRKLGLMVDLVILNTKDTGYAHELNEKIHQAITVMDSQNVVNRRGGIFIVTASQIDIPTLCLLKTAASVVFKTKVKSIAGFLGQASVIKPHLPIFIPSEPDQTYSTDKTLKRPENLIFDNGIGGFTPDGKEYQIFIENYPQSQEKSGQITPMPWANVIANEDFGFLITEAGGGYTWAINSGENRLTPWTNDPISDPSGECLYLRDEITGKVWSPTPFPAGDGSDYLIRHGQGYTIFESIIFGLKQELKVYTDDQSPVKIIALSLENMTNENRRITATYFAEWVLGPNREKSKAFIVPDYDNESGSLLAKNTYSADFSERVAFLTSDQPVHGLTTDRLEFLGSPGERHTPAGLKRIGLSGRVKPGLDPCAALQTHLNINPGETLKVTFILGQGSNDEEARKLAGKFSQTENCENSWESARNAWDAFLNTLQVETPEPKMDLLLNRWLPYQTLSSRIWGRSGLFQSSGAYGFRDQLQDVCSLLATKPDISRRHILRAAEHQFEAGDVLHWWHPPSGKGVRTRLTDDLLWLVYVTAEYIEKTGDIGILDEKMTFKVAEHLNDDEEDRYGHYETGDETYPLFEHCRRALVYGDTQGPHGLPLIGTGDWNDGMNRVGIGGKGESIWLAWFLYENHKRFSNLCKVKAEDAMAKEHDESANQLKEVINQVGWDGDWFLRAFYDDGTPLGSHKNDECQIDSLSQSWAILTQGATHERQLQAIQSVNKKLVHQKGRLIQLFTPPFDKTKNDPGYIKGYPPGVRENGGQYTHAAIWSVWALTRLGKGNQAFEQFQMLNPVTHSLDIISANQYKVEPYVVAADVYSTPPFTGRGGWTWYTGSSGWLYRLGTEAILGFQLEGDHIKIDPCIPEDWDGFKITYQKHETTYHLNVENPEHIEQGIKSVSLDGKILKSNAVPLQNDNKDHEVTVIMGKIAVE